MKRLISIVALPVILAGCAVSGTAAKFGDAPTPVASADQAVLYIFRKYAEPTAWSADFQIDDRSVASLAQQGFTWIYVSPGKHRLTQKWPFLAGMPALNFEREFEANKIYVFEIKGNVTYWGVSEGKMHFTSRSAVAAVELEQAKQAMTACCRYVEAARQ